jgi:hypothetical protein
VFPPEERYELSAQTRKASYSIAANIVEGFARRPGRERLHQYLDQDSYDKYELEVRMVGVPLRGLVRAEQKKLGAVFLPAHPR